MARFHHLVRLLLLVTLAALGAATGCRSVPSAEAPSAEAPSVEAPSAEAPSAAAPLPACGLPVEETYIGATDSDLLGLLGVSTKRRHPGSDAAWPKRTLEIGPGYVGYDDLLIWVDDRRIPDATYVYMAGEWPESAVAVAAMVQCGGETTDQCPDTHEWIPEHWRETREWPRWRHPDEAGPVLRKSEATPSGRRQKGDGTPPTPLRLEYEFEDLFVKLVVEGHTKVVNTDGDRRWSEEADRIVVRFYADKDAFFCPENESCWSP